MECIEYKKIINNQSKTIEELMNTVNHLEAKIRDLQHDFETEEFGSGGRRKRHCLRMRKRKPKRCMKWSKS